MNKIIFLFFIIFTPIIVFFIFENFVKRNKKIFIILYLLISIIFFNFFSPKPIFFLLGMFFILLFFYIIENFYEEIARIDFLFTPEVNKLELELKSVLDKTEEIIKKSKVIEKELVKLKEYYRVVEEMNESLDLSKLLSEFYFILKNRFENSIEYLSLIKLRKNDILDISIAPSLEKGVEIEIKNSYFNFISRGEFKNCISLPILKNYYEYILVIKFFENVSKEKVVPELSFLFEEIKIGFERAILFREIEELSRIDGLTGLYLRRYFMQRLKNEFLRINRYKEEFSILMFDIDFFKRVNDIYGHLAGDYILKEVSNILKNIFKDLGLISRWGGEEFLVFLPYHNVVKTCEMAEDVRGLVEKSNFFYDGQQIKVTISSGISCFPSDSQILEELVEIADNRLYEAKKTGRNKVVCK